MRYVRAKCEQYKEELAYRFYITDCLYYQGENKRLTERFAEKILPRYAGSEKTGDEIAAEVIAKIGLKVE